MSSPNKKLSALELVIVVIIVGWLYAFAIDIFDRAKPQAYAVACRSNLKRIGQSLHKYRQAHGGEMPASLGELVASEGMNRLTLECIATSYSLADRKPYFYTYRRLARPRPRDIVAWDRRPHDTGHTVFVWKNYSFRQVLRADGSVSKVDEDAFLALGLRGITESAEQAKESAARALRTRVAS